MELDALERVATGSSCQQQHVTHFSLARGWRQVAISKSEQSSPAAPVAPQLTRLMLSDEESRRTACIGALQHALVLLLHQHRLVHHQDRTEDGDRIAEDLQVTIRRTGAGRTRRVQSRRVRRQ